MGNRPAHHAVRHSLVVAVLIGALSLEGCAGTVTGHIVLRGSTPHAYVALITDDGHELRVVGSLESQIREMYQSKLLTVAGEIIAEAKGPGFPAELRVDRIVSVRD